MNIDFSDKEVQVIQLIVPEMSPAEACTKVLRDWFNANLPPLIANIPQPEAQIDAILAADKAKKSKLPPNK